MELKKQILDFSQEELELIKANSENMIQDLSKATDSLESKANLTFSFLLLIIGSCIGIIITEHKNIDFTDIIIHVVILVLIASFFSINQIYKALSLNESKLFGTKPDFHINYDGYVEKNRIKEILKDIITTNQSIIETNTELHNKKVIAIEKSLDWIMKGIFFTISYVILYLLIVNFLS